jgi:hypothetical protein
LNLVTALLLEHETQDMKVRLIQVDLKIASANNASSFSLLWMPIIIPLFRE